MQLLHKSTARALPNWLSLHPEEHHAVSYFIRGELQQEYSDRTFFGFKQLYRHELLNKDYNCG